MGKKRPKLKSLARTSRLDFKECANRKVRLLQQEKEYAEKGEAEEKAWLLQREKELAEKKAAKEADARHTDPDRTPSGDVVT